MIITINANTNNNIGNNHNNDNNNDNNKLQTIANGLLQENKMSHYYFQCIGNIVCHDCKLALNDCLKLEA